MSWIVSYRSLSLATFAALGAVPLAAAVGTACVPTGNAPAYDAGPAPTLTATVRASQNIMTAVFEDDFSRPDGGDWSSGPSALAATSASALPRLLDAALVTKRAMNEGGLDALLADAEARSDAEAPSEAGAAIDAGPRLPPSLLGPNWTATKPGVWRVENGRLCGENARNRGVWLNRTLPINARIEFDAYAMTDDGDLKTEVWGDGKAYATTTSYTNATSYLAILGGWHNGTHALARLNEHGSDRREIQVDKASDDPRQRAVVRGQLYQFKVERTDGKTIRVSVNGIEYFSWADPSPLAGQGHDHFGFNEWEVKVCFDNVKVTPLP